MHSKGLAYFVAVLTALLYSAWYISMSFLANTYTGTYTPIFVLLLMFLVLLVLRLFPSRNRLHLYYATDIAYPAISGLFYALGNYLFYVVIFKHGVQFASSFGSAEIVFFVLFLLLAGKQKTRMGYYLLGSLLIATGLITESAVLGGVAISINASMLAYGFLIALTYGIATYFYYLSTKKIESVWGTIFYVTFFEAATYFLLFVFLYKSIAIPRLDLSFALLLGVASGILFVAFLAETVMMKLLEPFGEGTTATGYILSDLELLPVMFYAVYLNPSTWLSFVPGMILITAGMALLDWRKGSNDEQRLTAP
ncbi:MAG: hypothetical protein ACP5T3_00190 [Candidatus Micrarchaeia archaeon]